MQKYDSKIHEAELLNVGLASKECTWLAYAAPAAALRRNKWPGMLAGSHQDKISCCNI